MDNILLYFLVAVASFVGAFIGAWVGHKVFAMAQKLGLEK